jgi:F-type H+-transporting ATPase subunit c
MEGNIADGFRYLGAGLATLGMIGSAIGVGNIFASFLDGALRNPSAASKQTGNLFVGAALAEALGLFAFVLAILILLGIF